MDFVIIGKANIVDKVNKFIDVWMLLTYSLFLIILLSLSSPKQNSTNNN